MAARNGSARSRGNADARRLSRRLRVAGVLRDHARRQGGAVRARRGSDQPRRRQADVRLASCPPGDIEARWSTYLREGLDDRLEADYNVFASYSVQQAEQECERAREFLARMRRYLIENGLHEHDLDQDVDRG